MSSSKEKYAFVLGASSMLAVAAAVGGIYMVSSDNASAKRTATRLKLQERKQALEDQRAQGQPVSMSKGKDHSATRRLLEKIFADLSQSPHVQVCVCVCVCMCECV
jgi:type II secretory pathway predicted ATPase ExeA